MNSSRGLLGICVIVVGLIASLFVTIRVITDNQNALAQFAGYLAIAGFIFGALFGGRALLLLLLLIAYGDLVKRGLVLFGSLSYLDIGKVLMAAPLTLTGICINLLWGTISGRVKVLRMQWHVFFGCIFVSIITAGYSMVFYTSTLMGLKNVALGSAYMMIPWVVVMTLKTPEQILGFMKTFLIVFFPVALYGINQGIFGLSDFELDYMRSGYTLEGRQLAKEVIRVPSTMNAARSLSVTMALCIMIFMSMRIHKAKGWIGLLHPLTIIVVPIFTLAMIFSLTRIGWVSALIFPVLAVAFAGRIRTLSFYAVSAACFSVLVAYSEPILKRWEDINKAASEFVGADTAFGRQATSMGTLSARLIGWRNLTRNSELWSPFGVDEKTLDNAGELNLNTGLQIDRMSRGLAHDVVTQMIVKYGLVPFFFASIVVILVMRWFHSLPFALRDPNDRRLTVMILACIVAVGISGISSGMHVPINALLFFFVGMALSMAVRAKEERLAPVVESESNDALEDVPHVGVSTVSLPARPSHLGT